MKMPRGATRLGAFTGERDGMVHYRMTEGKYKEGDQARKGCISTRFSRNLHFTLQLSSHSSPLPFLFPITCLPQHTRKPPYCPQYASRFSHEQLQAVGSPFEEAIPTTQVTPAMFSKNPKSDGFWNLVEE